MPLNEHYIVAARAGMTIHIVHPSELITRIVDEGPAGGYRCDCTDAGPARIFALIVGALAWTFVIAAFLYVSM
jgi:hypothetical protein